MNLIFLSTFDVENRPIPARRHYKNVLESKHKIIKDIFLQVKENNETLSDTIPAQQAIRISNGRYGNDVCSSYEIAKGYTRAIEPGEFPKILPEDIQKARKVLIAKQKLNLILKSKSRYGLPIKVGDQVQIFIKL